MKKIFVILAMTLFSLNVFADSRSCPIYGMDGVTVSVDNSVRTASDIGEAFSEVKLSSTNNTGKTITVAVNCYDMANKYVDTKEIKIHHGQKSGYTWFMNLEKGKVYQFRIASASCQ